MSREAYVNGRFVPLAAAQVSVEDRGFQFADAVYEVWGVRDGRLMDEAGHYARLWRSLRELQIAAPMSEASLRVVIRETARRNRVKNGVVYLQVSRGAARRDHGFPNPPVAPTIVVTAKNLNMASIEARARTGVAVVTAPDIRWGRCDIKTVGLLPNVLAKQEALDGGAFDAWLVRDGMITEGTASNAWIVDQSGKLRTAPLSENILHGVTRAALIRLAEERQIAVEERSFDIEEAMNAREAFLSSASNAALPVVIIDGKKIGDGQPGPVARLLYDAYFGAA
ncbi:MAG: D-amino-acid transaminase [Hyphomonadaceae bacterium]